MPPAAPATRRIALPATGWIGLGVLLFFGLSCFLSLPWSLERYNTQQMTEGHVLAPPSAEAPMGTDGLGRSLLWRCLLGGSISLGIGFAAAVIAVVIGLAVGATAGYLGGRVDALLMRAVDVLYGLPYLLLVVLLDMGLKPGIHALAAALLPRSTAASAADVATLLLAIGAVSWLTMARVIRGQTLSLRTRPFLEACRALGLGPLKTMRSHLLPNLLPPVLVYATLSVPTAILQESLLSFLGIGVQAPLPSWGNLAAEGVKELPALLTPGLPNRWWLLLWPCALLGITLLALNFLGDALRTRFDPRGNGG